MILKITSAMNAIRGHRIARLIRMINTMFVLRPSKIRTRGQMLYPRRQSNFYTLVTRVRLSVLRFVEICGNPILHPTLIVSYYERTINEQNNNGSVRSRTFIMAICKGIRFPAMFQAPIPVRRILTILTMRIPIRFTPRLISTNNRNLLNKQAISMMLISKRRHLRSRNYFCRITTVIFLPRKFRLTHVTVPPIQMNAIRAINNFRRKSSFLRSFRPFLTNSVTTICANGCNRSTRTTSTKHSCILIILQVSAIRISTFTYRSTIKLNAFPRMIRNATLCNIRRNVITRPIFFNNKTFTLHRARRRRRRWWAMLCSRYAGTCLFFCRLLVCVRYAIGSADVKR